jgi:hypothetical protein
MKLFHDVRGATEGSLSEWGITLPNKKLIDGSTMKNEGRTTTAMISAFENQNLLDARRDILI